MRVRLPTCARAPQLACRVEGNGTTEGRPRALVALVCQAFAYELNLLSLLALLLARWRALQRIAAVIETTFVGTA